MISLAQSGLERNVQQDFPRYSSTPDNVIYVDFKKRHRICPMGGVLYDRAGQKRSTGDQDAKYTAEADKFRQYLTNYISKEGKSLLSYMAREGKKLMPIEGVGSLEMNKEVAAATIVDLVEKSAYIVSNGREGFDAKVRTMAQQYRVEEGLARQYIIDHELIHCHEGYQDERKTEAELAKYYSSMALKTRGKEREKYMKLREIAKDRKESVARDYKR